VASGRRVHAEIIAAGDAGGYAGNMAKDGTSRRQFFYGTLLAGALPAGGFGSTPSLKHLGYKSPNEKLNIAAIGAGGKGRSDIAGCKAENIVAFADPDDASAASTYNLYPDRKSVVSG